jgi:hypothetical protein
MERILRKELSKEEERVLGLIDNIIKKVETDEDQKTLEAYLTAFSTAMKVVKYEMKALPGEEFIRELNKCVEEIKCKE